MHLWKDKWIDDETLEHFLPSLDESVSQALRCGLDLSLLIEILEDVSSRIKQDRNLRDQFCRSIGEIGTVSLPDIEEGLNQIAWFISRESIKEKLLRELGSEDPFHPARTNSSDPIYEAWAPLGLLVHVTPTNVFSVPSLSLVEGLLAGNVNVIKTSAEDSLFPQMFAKILIDSDPSKTLKEFVYVLRISSKRKDLLGKLFTMADGISAWGGEEAIAGVRALSPPSARIIEWGHKISFVYIAEECIDDVRILEPMARDCCLIEQQACSSPQCIYIETKDMKELISFGERFANVLDKISRTFPRVLPGLQEQAEITSVAELTRLEACLNSAKVIEAEDKSWRILIEFRSGLRASPLFRSVWIKPLLKEDIITTLRPLRSYLQTVGLACGPNRFDEISHFLTSAGTNRIRSVGEMVGLGYMGEPHDGVYALQRYTRRISCLKSVD